MARDDLKFDIHAKDKTQRAFQSVKSGLGSMVAGLAAGGAAFGVFAKSVIDAGDEVQKMALRTGASTEWISQMNHVVALGGGSMSEFTGSVRKMQKSVADAGNGLSTPIKAFGALGIEVDRFKKLSPEQQFDVMADALMKIEDPAKRTQVAMDIMGRSGSQMLSVMEGGSAAMSGLRAEAAAMGMTLSQDSADAMANFNDSLSRLSNGATASGRVLVEAMLPALTTISEYLGEHMPRAVMNFLRGWALFRQRVIEGTVIVMDKFRGLAESMAALPDAMGGGKFREWADSLKATEQNLITMHGELADVTTIALPRADEALKKNAVTLKDVYNPALAETASMTLSAAKATNDFQRQAQSVFASTRTDLERYNAELEKLNTLKDKGLITQETYGRALEKAQKTFDDAAQKGKEASTTQVQGWGEAKGALEDYATSGMDDLDSLKRAGLNAVMEIGTAWLQQKAGMQNGGGFDVGGGSGGGGFDWLGTGIKAASSMFSFAGGGSTGNGPRSGGLDGQGGFAAILHPQETVTDHTISGGGMTNGRGGPTFYVDNRGASEDAVRRLEQFVRSLDGSIELRAVGAVANAKARGLGV